MTTQANKEELDMLLKHINKLQLEQHEALEKVAALRKTLNPTEETMFTIREGAKKRKVGIKEEATGLAVKEEEEDRTSSDEANNQDDDPVIKEEARSKKLGKYFDGTDALDDNSLDIVIGFLDLYPRACLRRTCKRLKARVDFHQEDGIMIVEEDEEERKKRNGAKIRWVMPIIPTVLPTTAAAVASTMPSRCFGQNYWKRQKDLKKAKNPTQKSIYVLSTIVPDAW